MGAVTPAEGDGLHVYLLAPVGLSVLSCGRGRQMPIGEGSATVKLHFVCSYEKRSAWGLGDGSPHQAQPLTRACVPAERGGCLAGLFQSQPQGLCTGSSDLCYLGMGTGSCPPVAGFPELCHINDLMDTQCEMDVG